MSTATRTDPLPRQRSTDPARRGKRPTGATAAYWITGTVLAVVFVGPLAWAVVRSLQPGPSIAEPLAHNAFSELGFGNYTQLFSGQIDLLRYVGNSLIVSVGTAVLTALLATLAGYGFGRFFYRGSGVVFALILVTLMVPFQAILTPLFLEMHAMGLTDSLLGLVIFYTTFNLPFGVFVMRNSFSAIPAELEDSAYVDGAGVMSTLVRVLRPLVVPGVATTVLYTFLSSWTEFLGALTFLTSNDKLTLPVALLNIQNGTYGQVNFGYLVAGSVVSMIPTVALYIALQRYYIQGLTTGAVKG